jgi:ABC-type nitrate/sulfonate/bicarbonate transport system substrate-binding protein
LFSRTKRWAGTAALAAAVAAVGCSTAGARPIAVGKASAVKLKVAYGNQTIDFMPLVVASKTGIFERNGLDVELVNGTGGRGPTFLAAGQADIAMSDGPTFMTANTRGANLTLVSVSLNRFIFKLVGSTSIANVKGLVGKTLALSSPGAAVDVAGRAMLAANGVSASDVKIVYISDVPSRLAALNSGSVDAMIASPPVSTVLQKGKFKVIYDLVALRNVTISSWASEKWAKANVDTLKRYIRADIEANRWIKNPANAAALKKLISDWTGYTDTDSIDESFAVVQKEFQPEPLVDPKSVANSIATVKSRTGVTLDRDSFLFLSPLAQVVTYKLSSKLTVAQQVPKPKKRSAGSATFTGTLTPQGKINWSFAARKLTSPVTRIELYTGKPGKAGKAVLQICAPCSRSGVKPVQDTALERQIKEGGTYVVVQTKKNPAGEVRGQIVSNFG